MNVPALVLQRLRELDGDQKILHLPLSFPGVELPVRDLPPPPTFAEMMAVVERAGAARRPVVAALEVKLSQRRDPAYRGD